MTILNLSLQSTSEISQEIKTHKHLLEEIQLFGYLQHSLELQNIMKKEQVVSFLVKSVETDFEGGYIIKIDDIFRKIGDSIEEFVEPPEIEWGAATQEEIEAYINERDRMGDDMKDELTQWCSTNQISLDDSHSVVVRARPTKLQGKTFTPELDNIMSLICPPELYEAWKILKSKTYLEQNLQPVSGNSNLNLKPSIKI